MRANTGTDTGCAVDTMTPQLPAAASRWLIEVPSALALSNALLRLDIHVKPMRAEFAGVCDLVKTFRVTSIVV